MNQIIQSKSSNEDSKDYPVTNINISIDDEGIITLYNDGNVLMSVSTRI